MADKGWIKVHRQLQECWIWLDNDKFTKGQAWVDLLLFANHRDTKIPVDGKARGGRICGDAWAVLAMRQVVDDGKYLLVSVIGCVEYDEVGTVNHCYACRWAGVGM